jgi:hypothetical protein
VSELLERQLLFTSLVPLLIDRACELGVHPKLDEVTRGPVQALANAMTPAHRELLAATIEGHDPEFAAALRAIVGTPGTRTSLHILRLAVDLDLMRGDLLLTRGDEPEWARLASYWKSLHPLCRAGLDFSTRVDARHFSVTPDGVRA